MNKKCLIIGAVALSSSMMMAGAYAEPGFAGKNIDLIVPYDEGGGSSVFVRFLEPFMNKYLPGGSKIVVKNMPGGGSIKGINYFSRNARTDGTMIANTGTGTILAPILGNPAVQYELKDFIPVISSPFGVIVYGSKKLGVTADNIETLKGKQLVYGDRSPVDGGLPVLLALELLGTDTKYIWGLEGGERRQAFMRGELNLTFDNMSAYSDRVKPMIDDGTAVPLFTLGFRDETGKIVRDPMLPELPTFFEVYEKIHGKPLEGSQLGAMNALFMSRIMAAKMIVLPPKTPKDVVDAYDAVFAKIVNDPDFKNGVGEASVGPYPQSVGEQARKVIQQATQVDQEARDWLRKWLGEKFDVKL